MNSIDKLTIKGFKSIKDLVDFKLSNLNVFIGGNGAGKSNLIDFFTFVQKSMDASLLEYVLEHGGMGDFLFNGRKNTDKITLEVCFNELSYAFEAVEVLNR